MQNLMELDYGWASLDSAFIFKIVQILSSPHSPINVCRPATAILKKLVEADPVSAHGPQLASSSKGPPAPPPDSVYRYGFSVVFEQMRKERGLLETVVSRLGSADTAMAQYRYIIELIFHNLSSKGKHLQYDAHQLAIVACERHSLGGVHHGVGEAERSQSCCCEGQFFEMLTRTTHTVGSASHVIAHD